MIATVLSLLPDCIRSTKCGPNTACSCTESESRGLTVDCHGANLSVSEICKLCKLYKNTTNLNISSIRTNMDLPDDCFLGCNRLKNLSLANNNISVLKDHVFAQIPQLESLDLSLNKFIDDGNFVNPSIFQYLTSLKVLQLQGNVNRSLTRFKHFLPNLPSNKLHELHELFIDGPENITLGPNFRFLKNLKNLDFTGKHSLCNVIALSERTFENIPQVEYLNLAFCNLSFIEAGSFERLHNLKYLNLSHNVGLGFVSLRNVSYGLQSTQINVLDYSKVYKEFGLCTELRRCDVWFLKNTTMKELYLNENRLAVMEVNALHLFPPLLEVFSAERNQLSFGPYVLQTSCLRNIITLKLNHQYQFSSIMVYNREAYLKEKVGNYTEQCHVPKPKKVDPICPYLDDGPVRFSKIDAPPNLKVIQFRDSNVKTKIAGRKTRMKVSFRNNITNLDVSFNVIYEWNGPLVRFEELQHVNLSSNFAYHVSPNFFSSAPNLKTLDASNNLLGEVLSQDTAGLMFKPLQHLEVLNLSLNKVTVLPKELFSYLNSLKTLILAFNGISEVNTSLARLTNLSFLDLRQNKISSLPLQLLQQMDDLGRKKAQVISIDLSNNSLEISCENLHFLQWILDNSKYFKHLDFYTYRINGESKVLSEKDLKKTVDSVTKNCKSYTTAIVLSTMFIVGFLCVIVVGIVYRYRWRLRYLYYMAKSRYTRYNGIPDTAIDYQYEVFVSYAHEDDTFIKDEIIVELEEKCGLPLCVHQRDFLPGNYIAENILQAIKNSRMIVIVLSNHFLQSKWCIYEFNMARMESIYSRNGENVIFCIMYEDIDTKHLSPELIQHLEHETFLKYPQDEHEKPYFWEMLKRALSNN